MIYKVVARNPKGEVLEMPLNDPWSSGINIKNITGISPVGAEIYQTPFASIDGGIFSGSRVPSREIVMTLGLMPKPEIEDARHITYNFFRIKDPINLLFITTNRILQIDGYVKDNDVDIFSKSETATVTITCVNPWFYANTNTRRGFSGTVAEFEFPFSSEQYATSHNELIEFGTISPDTRTELTYYGDIEIGINMEITFLGPDFHNIYFYNMVTRERMNIYTDQIELLTGSPLGRGDIVNISTVSGQKSASLIRNEEYVNIISAVDKNSDWLQLTKGSNIFAFSSDYGVDNIMIDVTWKDTFAGI